ncbi:undecaprenyldiphospho-muramoylpentapeptide beta-N-acetylglucosaminyltransferase [Alteromonas aestuariivivens]|uniref:UDP-N-acetylglucosamine--N-acetylmuramyl-(pentapeptide) pyrophosphoryl-undecaprenol N-acetylglucosamine transferase n=1 Tax=Alteromonas aestuariivivens TaxID=1938339 RepID=A0A3D8MDZ9_9ALTE|nr:undecaprenyldiphospho-muramoylpentapeptide beta-N-acetylglucosaminyltransferase [Alteromonas aestuariivivens]RDV29067.1 undecaprenyldiphospho-muramoylpentapeptide beta-N-acetylglucosaminyltransferase [Alteromonas aestuariivivens]
MTKRCLVMAGGTGGHVFPGLAVAKALRAKGWDIQWLGTAERMEAQVVPANGFPIHFIPVKGLRGKGLSARLAGLTALVKALMAAKKLIRELKPDLVIGLGGYASGPGGLAAWLAGVPVVIHEQNAAAGMTNRLLGRIARRILLGFDDAQSQFSARAANCVVVGNPVRAEFLAMPAHTSIALPMNMLVVGGSLGSAPLNEIVPQVCRGMSGLSVWHQTGKGNQQQVEARYQGGVCDVRVTEFIDDMAGAYEWADFVVCRAGALTVAEVAASGRAAIFVPLPHAVDDHQTKNALSLVKHKAAILIPQPELQKRLGKVINDWLDSPEQCLIMGQHAREQARLDATIQVVTQCEALVGEAA